MRDKIADLLENYLNGETEKNTILKILALLPSLEGIVVEEKCNHIPHVIQEGSRNHVMIYETNGMHCSEPKCEKNCKCHGTGTITRPAEWGDIPDMKPLIKANEHYSDCRLFTPSGGRLKVREKD